MWSTDQLVQVGADAPAQAAARFGLAAIGALLFIAVAGLLLHHRRAVTSENNQTLNPIPYKP